MNFETTLYDILGVSSSATPEEVKKAYRKKSRLLHPDTTGQDTTDMFQMVQRAYEVLSKEDTRAEYDQHLEHKENPPPEAAPYEEPSWGEEETWGEDSDTETVWGEEVEEDEEDDPADFFQEPEPYSEPVYEEADDGEDAKNFFAPFRPVNMKRLSWYGNVPFENEKLTPGPTSKVDMGTAFGSLGVLLLSALLPLYLLSVGEIDKLSGILLTILMVSLTLPTIGQVIPFPINMRYSKPARISSLVSFILAALGMVFFLATLGRGGLMFFMDPSFQAFISLAFVVLILTTPILGYVFGKRMRTNKQGDLNMVSENTARSDIFGIPGQLQDAVDKFGEDNIQAGMEGEKRTAKLLESMAVAIPSVRVFHGLNFPGSKTADVDHAILVGNRLALIDSKMWRENHYEWDETGNISEIKPNGYSFQRITHFPTAVEKYSQMFPNLDVHGWILIHPRKGRASKLSFDNSYATNSYLGDAENALNEMGDWLLDGKKAQTVNRRTMRKIFNNMK